jgi:hypothetical protein
MKLDKRTRESLVNSLEALAGRSTPENSLGGCLVVTMKILADAVLTLAANDDEKPVAKNQKRVGRRKGHAGKLLTEKQKRKIVASMVKPEKLMSLYDIKFDTIRRIKSGLGIYAEFGGSNLNWRLYQGTHPSACVDLRSRLAMGKVHPLPYAERMHDIVESAEHPTVLLQRYGRSMAHIRAVKRGYGRYASFGGDKDKWAGYYKTYAGDIDRLLHRRKGRAA